MQILFNSLTITVKVYDYLIYVIIYKSEKLFQFNLTMMITMYIKEKWKADRTTERSFNLTSVEKLIMRTYK